MFLVGLVVVYFRFCLENSLLPSILNDNCSVEFILFGFSTLDISCLALVVLRVIAKKSAAYT